MAGAASDPEKQSGTGEPRSSGHLTQDDGSEREDSLRPPDEEQTRREVNRSGSGGSGGPVEGDPREEGSGSRSLEDMLAGDE